MLIAWSLLSAWVGVAVYVLGDLWWTPSIWPIAFVIYMTWIIRRWEKAAIASISQTEPSAPASQTETANLDQEPRQG